MIAVGIGEEVSFDELNAISSEPTSLVFHVDNFGALESIKSSVLNVASRECIQRSEYSVLTVATPALHPRPVNRPGGVHPRGHGIHYLYCL